MLRAAARAGRMKGIGSAAAATAPPAPRKMARLEVLAPEKDVSVISAAPKRRSIGLEGERRGQRRAMTSSARSVDGSRNYRSPRANPAQSLGTWLRRRDCRKTVHMIQQGGDVGG